MNLCIDRATMLSTTHAPRKHHSEEALKVLFQQGDHEAFSLVCSQHYPRLLRTALRIVKDSSDAQDAVQDAFLSAFKAMSSFKAASSISTWLTRIVINSCLIQLRKRKRRPTVSLDVSVDDSTTMMDLLADPRVDTLGQLMTGEQQRIMSLAVESLRPDLREALLLFYQKEKMPLTVVAKKSNISLPALKSRVYRAKRALERECGAVYMSPQKARHSASSLRQRAQEPRL